MATKRSPSVQGVLVQQLLWLLFAYSGTCSWMCDYCYLYLSQFWLTQSFGLLEEVYVACECLQCVC